MGITRKLRKNQKLRKRCNLSIIILAEIFLLLFISSMVEKGVRVVFLSDAYYQMDCREIEVIYNNSNYITSNTLTHSKDGYIVEFTAKEFHDMQFLSIHLTQDRNGFVLKGIEIDFWGITLQQIDVDKNDFELHTDENQTYLKMDGCFIKQLIEKYFMLITIVRKLILIGMTVLIGLTVKKDMELYFYICKCMEKMKNAKS